MSKSCWSSVAKHARLCVALPMAFAAVLGLAGGFASAAPALTRVRIEVPNIGNLQFFTLWVALGAGYFEQEGLMPEILVAPATRSVGDRLFTGEADVALLPPPMFLGLMAEDKPIRLFASLLANEPIDLVLRQDVAQARAFSPAAPLGDRLHKLAGLRIGLAGEVAPRLRALFAAAGMNPDKDAKLVVVDGPDQVASLRQRRVDALFAHTPYLETVLVEDGAVLVADNSGGEVAELAQGQVHALAATREAIGANPERIAAVTRAIARAERLIHSDPKASVDAILASGFSKAARPQLEVIAQIYAAAVPAGPKISVTGIERDARLYPAHPRAPDFARVKAADFVATEFAP